MSQAAGVAGAVVEVADLAHDGRGVARMDGRVVFVHDALPGERVRLGVRRRRRGVDEAELAEVLEPSPHRVTPRCAHFGVCGGCALQHLDPAQQIAFKQKQLLDALQRIGNVAPQQVAPPVQGPAWGYRRRARLGVKHVPKKGGTVIGFRERRSHFLTHSSRCEVLDPRVGQRLIALAQLIDGLSIRQQVPQIEVAASDRVALVLRVLKAPTDTDLARLRAFGAGHGVDIYLQPGGLDSVRALDDVPLPTYSPDGSALRLRYAPTDFIQVNEAVAQAMVRQALAWLAPAPGDRVLELFCGLGNFSLPLARTGAQVTAVEGDDVLLRRGQDNAAAASLDLRWIKADLFQPDAHPQWIEQGCDLALLDPPRVGAEAAVPLVAGARPRRIVYVSCHPGTLARDAGTLVHEFGYRLRRAGVLDMFPHTAHVESMALLEKV